MKKLIKKLWLGAAPNMWNADIAKEKYFLAAFPEPEDLIQRSYFQYKCHSVYYAGIRWTIWELIAFFTIIPFIILLLLYGLKKVHSIHSAGVFMGKIAMKYVRKTIENECSQWEEINVIGPMAITWKDLKYFFPIWIRYFFAPLFTFKILMKLARYSWIIRKYSPQIIMTEEASSFPSSVMTCYCCSRGIKHFFIQHGELLFSLRDTFAAFDRYYVWDDFYATLYKELRFPANADYRRVEYFNEIATGRTAEEKIYDYTYYLQAEKQAELCKKRDYLKKLQKRGAKIAVRPHPIHTNISDFNKIFTDFEKEDPKTCSLEVSLSHTKNVISEYSSVLYQAHLAGINVIIDDICAPEKIDILRQRRYIMLNKNHENLSCILNNFDFGK